MNLKNDMTGGFNFEEPVKYPKFSKGDKFINLFSKKSGTIRSLKDDSYEKKERSKDPTHYYYHVDYDDGSFDTYVNQNNMKLFIPEVKPSPVNPIPNVPAVKPSPVNMVPEVKPLPQNPVPNIPAVKPSPVNMVPEVKPLPLNPVPNIPAVKPSPKNNLPLNISPTNIIQNNYMQLPNRDSIFVNNFRPKSNKNSDGFIPNYSNKTYEEPSEDSDNIDWDRFHQELNKDSDEEKKKSSKKKSKKSSKKKSKKSSKKKSKKSSKKKSKKSNKKKSKKSNKKKSKKSKKIEN